MSRADIGGLAHAVGMDMGCRVVLHEGVYVVGRALREYYTEGTGPRWRADPRDATCWDAGAVEVLIERESLMDVWRDEDGMILEASPWRPLPWKFA